jgi:hypothetical protein
MRRHSSAQAKRALAQVDRPAVAPCPDLAALRTLAPEQARAHVDAYLRSAMPDDDAAAFEALGYLWELHLVEIEQLQLLRKVSLDQKKVRRYRTVLNRGGGFPPLIALGGDGAHPTQDVLLCDGYHRAFAIRDLGIHYVWAWLAVDIWQPVAAPEPALTGCGV